MQDPRGLRVWHLAQTLAIDVIDALPDRVQRVPGLRAQMIRAATSVHANIAEGCGRRTDAEFLRFIDIAIGSLNELDAHLNIARAARVLTADTTNRLAAEVTIVRKMLLSLRRAIQSRTPRRR